MQESYIINISSSSPLFPGYFNRVQPEVTQIYAAGNTELLHDGRCLGIVGSRKPTSYGVQVTVDLARAAAQAGITIVSGLAFGVDSIAHQTALDCQSKTIAILPAGLKNIYPANHAVLAERIVQGGGLLLSEYYNEISPMKYYFIRRNRLIAAISHTLLVTEAGDKSGSRHTAEFAIDLGKNVCVVPGNITSPMSIGTNNLLKDGAMPVTGPGDLFSILGVHENLMKPRYSAENHYEQAIITHLGGQNLSSEALLEATGLEVPLFNAHLTMLEIKGAIEQTASKSWRLAK